MRSPIVGNHFSDGDGNPAGGTTYGNGFAIGWQNGPLGRGDERIEPNGAFVEDVIAAAVDRIEFYESAADGRFSCAENIEALASLNAALRALHRRTDDRERREVEGTHGV